MLGAPVRWPRAPRPPRAAQRPSSAPRPVATKAASSDIVVPSAKGDSTKSAVTGPVRLTPRLNQSTVWSHQPSGRGGEKVERQRCLDASVRRRLRHQWARHRTLPTPALTGQVQAVGDPIVLVALSAPSGLPRCAAPRYAAGPPGSSRGHVRPTT